MDRATAESQGLVKVVRNQLFLGVDNSSVLETKSQGRSSVRLESKETWSSGLLIADFAHMPGNQCGVWPALYAEIPFSSFFFSRRCSDTKQKYLVGPTTWKKSP